MQIKRFLLTLFLGFISFATPVLADDETTTLYVVFGVLGLILFVVALILILTVTVIAHNTDHKEDGLD